MQREGVTRFTFQLSPAAPPTEPVVDELRRWRRELHLRDVIGCDLSRYGACYGNVSARTGAWAAPPGRREFLVSGTQTGGTPEAGPEQLVRVLSYDHRRNRVQAQGPCAPSSETLTHGAIYDADLDVRAVVHGHDPQLWHWLRVEGAPKTDDAIDYGTPEMAEAARAVVQRARRRAWRLPGVLVMGGHEDGVIGWGASVAEATERFLAAWQASRTR